MVTRGGKRKGAGRPRKQHLTVVSASVAAAVTVPKVSGSMPDRPAMSAGARAVWERSAHHAHEAGTLTEATAANFAAVCEYATRVEVSRKAMDSAEGSDAWLGLARIFQNFSHALDVKMRGFRLAPNGLPMVKDEKAEKPKSALDRLKDRGQAMRVVGKV
jgi:hypothetical protein